MSTNKFTDRERFCSRLSLQWYHFLTEISTKFVAPSTHIYQWSLWRHILAEMVSALGNVDSYPWPLIHRTWFCSMLSYRSRVTACSPRTVRAVYILASGACILWSSIQIPRKRKVYFPIQRRSGGVGSECGSRYYNKVTRNELSITKSSLPRFW